ncbi:lysine-specific demethylase JMJ705-like [Cucurbita moschata]|uniref:Lysine-specific demethylase JMJ705-like n=1 Tax=Cucurbita moschata TaxID=3662 RepID=A0A6J1GTA4_CUCMO|nr:lysine-specific demethylase JMJ705-like [Cucurbita moschata]
MAASAMAAEPTPEVLSWLKTLPLAPEYHPTLAEFQDPISYIFKIEKEASKFGICKIVPPVLPSPKKTVILNFNKSLAARAPCSDSINTKSPPTFTTRQQQIGFCPRKTRPVQKPVWQSGEYYTFQQFEAKAKAFEKSYLKKCTKKGGLSPLELETLYWRATLDKPFSVEYANDMPGSAFVPVSTKMFREAGDGTTLGETAWNMRAVSRAKGSLLKFMKEEIPGVTSPMVYVAMLFSWFAWHVEDHDLHSLNYLHMGAGKTWYGVPRDAAVAFEEVVRVQGYGGEINPLVTFAILGEKTTVMSPEVLVSSGVPCCRLVQNAGEFVVTFPRAYHTGFSHGFNCAEAANIATPEWLRVAKDAAIRRASINYPPMVSHFQLLYDLALSSRSPLCTGSEPRSSRLKDKRRSEGETVIKELFVQNILENNSLLDVLGSGVSVVLLPQGSSDSIYSRLRVGSHMRGKLRFPAGFCNSKEEAESPQSFDYDNLTLENSQGMNRVKGLYSVNGLYSTLSERSTGNLCASSSRILNATNERGGSVHCDGLSDQRLFSCVTCGILSFACVAIVQPREQAARYLMSADCSFFNDWVVGSGITGEGISIRDGHGVASNSGKRERCVADGLYDVPVQAVNRQLPVADQSYKANFNAEKRNETSALGMLALAYGHSSDSEEDNAEADAALHANDAKPTICSSVDQYQFENSGLTSSEYCKNSATSNHDPLSANSADQMQFQVNDYEEFGRARFDSKDSFNCSSEFEIDGVGSTKKNDLSTRYQDSHVNGKPSLDTDTEKPMFEQSAEPVEIENMPFAPDIDEDSSRLHVFCLEHAKEVEQQLRPIGGVHILLLCHPDYPKMEAEAKLMAQELSIDHLWTDTTFRDATQDEEKRIQLALDSEEAIPGNGDWAVKLGINLFYSANLSHSPLYSKQMPYNSVIYNAFGRSTSGNSSGKPKVYQRRSGKLKRVVVGKWCGKVWMSNQIHPLLAKRDPQEEDVDGFPSWTMSDEKIEWKSDNIQKSETVNRKSAGKRKMTYGSGAATKKAEPIESEDIVSDNSGDDCIHQHHRILQNKRSKIVASKDVMSDDSVEDVSYKKHGRVPVNEEAYCETDDPGSDEGPDESLGDRHTKLHRGFYGFKLPKWGEIEPAVSDDSFERDSSQFRGKTSKSKIDKYVERQDALSDECLESPLKQYRRIPKSKQAKVVKKNAISHDIRDDSFLWHRQGTSRSKMATIDSEEAVSEDSFENSSHQHMSTPRSKSAKRTARENVFSDDPDEDDTSLLHHRKNVRNVQSKYFERENTPDDQLDDSANQCRTRVLRSKPVKKETISQTKQEILRPAKRGASRTLKEEFSQPLKRGGRHTLKLETPQPTKQLAPNRRGKQAKRNSKLTDLESEEEQQPGGPSTRLRQRTPKPTKFSETKPNDKRPIGKKKVKNASSLKTPAGHRDSKARDEESEYLCDIEGCNMSFGSKQELVLHKRNICPVKGCGKKFFSHKYLVQHRRVHMDDRPLKCPWRGCKMTFKWAWARTEHIRVHTGDRPYVCAEQGCGQTFRFVSDFSRHKRKTGHSTKKGRG